MKVIFLDIDGVLNSIESFEKTKKQYPNSEIRYDNPHPDHIQWLNKIVDETGAKVVISSTWRSEFSTMGFWRFLTLCGFRGEVIGKTPQLDTYRGTEIKCWLVAHQSKTKRFADSQWYRHKEEVDSFVIIDDDSDMEDMIDRLVKVDGRIGLTEKEADEAINMLNKCLLNKNVVV